MEPEEFKILAENTIYKEVAKYTNQILGKNKTAGLSTGLFLKLPIVVETKKVDVKLPKLTVQLEDFIQLTSFYTKIGNTTEVFFTFLYNEEKDLKAIERHIERHGIFLAFVYMHELQHIIRKHVTTSYNTMMLRIADGIQDPHTIINVAEDYAINYSIKDLFVASPLAKRWPEIEKCGLYNSKYHSEQMSDIDILKDLKANAKQPQCSSMGAGSGLEKVEMDGTTSIQPTAAEQGKSTSGNDNKTDTSIDDADISASDLAESIQDLISQQTRGTAAGDLFDQLFSSIKVETGWFKKIKASFKRKVYYMTHDYSTSWSNLNSTYRHIYKAPKKQFIDTKLEIVLSVDHSGSVSTEALQRLLYLMEETSKTISKLTVLIHDTRIVKEFVVEDDFDISNNKQFKEALATRYVVGGTSHSDVFNWLDTNIKDFSKTIYLSYSDNYSDIPQEWAKHPKLRNMTSYFVCTKSNPMRVPGGIDIALV